MKVENIDFQNDISKDLLFLAQKVERTIKGAKIGKNQHETMRFAEKMQEVSALIEKANTKIDEAVMR